MLFERRAYTMRSGRGPDFPATQIERGFDGPAAGFMSRLIGYFDTVSGPAEQVVHLYRYDGYDDWIDKLHGLYKLPELQAYFRDTRAIIREQRTDFMQVPPVAGAAPLWQDGRDWRAADGGILWDAVANPALIVEEAVTMMIPGGLPVYWQALAADLEAALGPSSDMIGTFAAVTGRLHVVRSYRVFDSPATRDTVIARRRADAVWTDFRRAVGDVIVDEATTLLRPIRVPEMSPMFRVLDARVAGTASPTVAAGD